MARIACGRLYIGTSGLPWQLQIFVKRILELKSTIYKL